MELCGNVQSKMYSCLFIGKKVMEIIYVDNILFWSVNENYIHEKAMQLRKQGVDLEQEENIAGFMGVTLGRDEANGLLEMKKVGLVDCVTKTLGLGDGMTKRKFTPYESKLLVRDADGSAPYGTFSYSSVVGMLLYLSGHTRPDIAYAVNCCARYMFCPKHSYETALKCIGRYLKATQDLGLILNQSSDFCKLYCYPDADFFGMYRHEIPTDPACVKNRTGFVITFSYWPVYWASKLQTKTALYTM